MEEIERLEMIHDDIKSEIDELKSLLQNSDKYLLKAKRQSFQKQLSSIVDNLMDFNDSVYGVFEDLNSDNMEQLQDDYDVLYDILRGKLTHEERIDMRIKHGIDFF